MHEMIIRKIGFKLYYKVVPHYIIKSMAHYSKMVICSTNTACAGVYKPKHDCPLQALYYCENQ